MRAIPLLAAAMAMSLATATVHALTRYSAAYNHFAGTTLGALGINRDGCVEIDNSSDTTLLVVDSALVTQPHYRYMARLANSHNRTGRSYRYYSADGRRHSRGATQCGIAVNITAGDTTMVMLGERDTAPFDDILGERHATLSVTRHTTGRVDTLATWQFTDGLDLRGGLNAVAADVNGNTLTVLAGDRHLQVRGTVTLPHATGAARVAVAAGSAAHVTLERTVLYLSDDVTVNRDTGMDAATLEQHFATSRDPNEGFYTYLDRDMDEKRARLGGRYTVALVRNGDGYDIIYVSGAQICPGDWYAGRLKGVLRRKAFTASYDLTWLDATGHSAPDESYASLEGGSILTLHFPLLDTTMRLHKQR